MWVEASAHAVRSKYKPKCGGVVWAGAGDALGCDSREAFSRHPAPGAASSHQTRVNTRGHVSSLERETT